MFDPVVLLTFGGPGTSTQTVAYFLWEQVWQFNKFSFGAAASILLLIMFSFLIFFGIFSLIKQRNAVGGRALTMAVTTADARAGQGARAQRGASASAGSCATPSCWPGRPSSSSRSTGW